MRLFHIGRAGDRMRRCAVLHQKIYHDEKKEK